MVYIVLAIFVFAVAVVLLILLKINKFQVQRYVYSQYNYIPESLISFVEVYSLKPDHI
ncbi:ac110 [Sucra jujuba nucleopolyhedrovirus]|uniref:Ac110 n=1 Tax=Sucra jujuba nucleopolyhedrovirus TaxID=1563660 RepID=A0A097P919_9ABAC|nr:ac110 [Sucra jujuba nucleopolyhedrovirus]AIU41327.1 ac110 [Sucra jujuba nucleopolyhedrovirus]